VVIELVGKGAMGEVYRVHQLNLKRDVAIKVISPEMIRTFEDDTEALAVNEKESVPSVAAIPPRQLLYLKPTVIWAGVLVALLSVAAMTLWHVFGTPKSASRIFEKKSPVSSETSVPVTLPSSIRGKDGILMTLVSGGNLPSGSDTPVENSAPIRVSWSGASAYAVSIGKIEKLRKQAACLPMKRMNRNPIPI